MNVPPDDDRSKVSAALHAVGSHRWVQLEVTDVARADGAVTIDLVIHYPLATPVCCGTPGCYLPCLGVARERVPAAIQAALALPAEPALTIRAALRHEPGYRYIDHATGRFTEPGIDHVQTYAPAHFSGRETASSSRDGR